jgi:putative peptidoglycan lipid II flippase
MERESEKERKSLSFWKRRHHMGVAALIMGSSVLLSRFMGLIRDKVISFLFGATHESDIYFAAFVIPDFINYLLAGAYFSITLIPFLVAYFEKDEEEGWRFFSTVFTWIALTIFLLTAVGMWFAPELARIAAPGLKGDSSARLSFFLRIVLPAQICFLLGSCFSAILYSRKQFFIPALTPLIYNLLIILGGILLRARGMEGFCWGVLAGALLGNLCLPYLAVKRGEGLKLHFSLSHPGLKRFVLLALPLMLGQSIVVLDEQFVRVFGSLVGTGVISWLNYARRIMMLPVGVVAQAAGVATYPFLADLFARKESSRFIETMNGALRNVMTILIPLSIWMMVIARPTITLIFQQGRFGLEDTKQTTLLLQILLVVVFCWGFQQILGRGFYAKQDTLTPAVLGTISTLISLPIFFVLTKHFMAVGVAVASASGIALYTGFLAWRWRHLLGRETFAGLGRAFLQVTAFSLSASLPALLIVYFEGLPTGHHPYLASLGEISISGLLFGLVFLLLSNRFAPALIRPFLERTGPLKRWLVR